MGHNPFATWKEYFFANLPDGLIYEEGFYVFTDSGKKFADYDLAIKNYQEMVRRGWKYVEAPATVGTVPTQEWTEDEEIDSLDMAPYFSGTVPLTFSTTTLPDGITRSGSTLSGTPTDTVVTSFTVTATNSKGSATQTVNIEWQEAPAAVGTVPDQEWTVGVEIDGLDMAPYFSGTAPLTFSTTTLPDGITMSGSTLSGTPTADDVTSFTVTATNAIGSDTQTVTIDWQEAE